MKIYLAVILCLVCQINVLLSGPLNITIEEPKDGEVFCGPLEVKGNVSWTKVVDSPEYRFTADQSDPTEPNYCPRAGAPDFTLPPSLSTQPLNCLQRTGGHKGVDIHSPIGSPIRSPYSGIVVKFDFEANDYGRYIYVYYPKIDKSLVP